MRYLTEYIKEDLRKKMVLLSGPRQTGKTTLAKSLAVNNGIYLNWDIRADNKIIRDISWPKDCALVVLGELHKYPRWKNYLKGLVDGFQNFPQILVTGSAKLETFRYGGDALTGRYYHYRLHPIDTWEAALFLRDKSASERLESLLKTGGFPEAFLNPDETERLRNDRFDLILQEDLRDLSKTNSIQKLKLLIELLRERVGGHLNYSSLSKELAVSAITVKSWIDLLERLYVIFIVPPYSGKLSRSLKKEPKYYFYDCAAGYSNDNSGPILENAVACSLFKYCHFCRDIFGKKLDLLYFRDRQGHEVDLVILYNNKPYWCLEVKTSDSELSRSLEYLHERIKPKASFQLVKNISRPLEVRGIKIINLASFLNDLFDNRIS